MTENICKFISTAKHDDRISIINFVYEKNPDFIQHHIIASTYSLCLVSTGSGILHANTGDFPLNKGDLFVLFSAKPYYIENCSGLQYLYISFTGLRGLSLLNRLQVSYASPVYPRYGFLISLWESTLEMATDHNADLFCEGLLLYSLGCLCQSKTEDDVIGKENSMLTAKEYIDMNYTDSELTLQSVSAHFSYDPKYFSSAFKKLVRANFSEYLRLRRINHAVMLMESGITNVANLAELCGYKDPLYFSKCFKKQFGCSPRQWLADRRTAND